MDRLIELLKNSKYCVAFTGAGVSTLSGIKDFRGKNGFYSQKDIDADKIFSLEYFRKDPSYYYIHSKDFIYNVDQKEPNIVHTELARLESAGIIKTVITQNIDTLHQKAGSHNVIEIHGTPATHHCMVCQHLYTYQQIVNILNRGDIPRCEVCGGIVKPDVTFFGEMLDETAITRAIEEASKADLMLVLGSSLVVQPAASLPLYTRENRGKVIIVNNAPTPLDYLAAAIYDDLKSFFTETQKLD